MKTKYITKSWGTHISTIQIEKETTHCVWVSGRKKNKANDYEMMHDSHEDAKEYILARISGKIANFKKEIGMLELELEQAEKLQP